MANGSCRQVFAQKLRFVGESLQHFPLLLQIIAARWPRLRKPQASWSLLFCCLVSVPPSRDSEALWMVWSIYHFFHLATKSPVLPDG